MWNNKWEAIKLLQLEGLCPKIHVHVNHEQGGTNWYNSYI